MTLRAALIWVCVALTTAAQNCPHDDATLKKWSDASTWSNNEQNPSKTNETVLINTRVLLDVQPANDIDCLVIATGAELVFSPDVAIELRVRSILVNGTLTIGSDTCPHTGKLLITVMGNRQKYVPEVFGTNMVNYLPEDEGRGQIVHQVGLITDSDNHADFGKKYIGVPSGGVVNIYGEYKKPWTKLAKTLPKLNPTAIIFRRKVTQEDKVAGFIVYVFDPTTGKPVGNMTVFNIRQKTQEKTDTIVQAIETFLKSVGTGKIVAMAVRKSIMHKDTPMDLSKLFDTLEKYAFGSVNNQSLLRKATFYDGFSIAFIKDDPSNTVQKFDSYKAGGVKQTSTAKMILRDKKLKIEVTSSTSSRGHGKSYVLFAVTSTDYSLPILTFVEEVSSWKPGDEVAISSTDFDWTQMEYAKVIDCEGKCSNKQVQLDLSAENNHYGEVYKNVDMRAAAAPTTRKVVIQGLMENGDDNFGAHLKILKGAKGVHIENVELAHMGQNDGLGKYPVHFHRLGSTTPAGAIVKGNAIHHTYSRCVTIHATNNVEVTDNACIESHGHGYFLEWGAELNTVFDGNVGFGQRRGTLEKSDMSPSTFYLSNPQTVVKNNYAAGGQGHGFWWVFPQGDNVQPEGSGGTFNNLVTPISEYSNNVACCNAKIGHVINGRILKDGKVVGSSDYCPTSHVTILRNTGFKNSYANFNYRADNITVQQLSAADSPYNVLLEGVRATASLVDSVIIGDSENTGAGVFDGQGQQVWTRSLPIIMKGRANLPRIGLPMPGETLGADGVWFSGFSKTKYYNAGALGYRGRSMGGSSLQSYVFDAKFDYSDSTDGNRVLAFDSTSDFYSGKEYAVIPDVDGSLTSLQGTYIVRPIKFHKTDNCVERKNWNALICDESFVQIKPSFKSSSTNTAVIERLDNAATVTLRNKQYANLIVGKEYGINFSEDIPTKITIPGINVDKDNDVYLAVCVRKGSTPTVSISRKKMEKKNTLAEVTKGNHYFVDETIGVVVVYLVEETARAADDEQECPAGMCTKVTITTSGSDKTNTDCIQNFKAQYPVNRKKRAVIAKSPRMRRSLSVPDTLPAGPADPPTDWGAGPQI